MFAISRRKYFLQKKYLRALGTVSGCEYNKMYASERILIELKLNQFWFDVYFIHIRSTSCEDYAKEWVRKYLWILYVHICISCQPTWLIGVILNDISVKFKYNNIFFIPHSKRYTWILFKINLFVQIHQHSTIVIMPFYSQCMWSPCRQA